MHQITKILPLFSKRMKQHDAGFSLKIPLYTYKQSRLIDGSVHAFREYNQTLTTNFNDFWTTFIYKELLECNSRHFALTVQSPFDVGGWFPSGRGERAGRLRTHRRRRHL